MKPRIADATMMIKKIKIAMMIPHAVVSISSSRTENMPKEENTMIPTHMQKMVGIIILM
jgi:hypothetical protein